jgi:hypothetical protein
MAAVPSTITATGSEAHISLQDLYDNTEYVERFIEESFEQQIAMLKATADVGKGKHVSWPSTRAWTAL